MLWAFYFFGLIVLAICLYGLLVLIRRLRQMRQTSTRTTVLTNERPSERPRRGRLLASALILVLIIGLTYGVWQVVQSRSPDQFLVLVAPFNDGGDGSTGRNVAAELTRLLQTADGSLSVELLDTAPADPNSALALAGERAADLLIYGAVEPGGMLDEASLRPQLIFNPTGAYGPNAWEGYRGRFAMPRSYTLSDEPINGQAVLAPMVLILRDYSLGASDPAYEALVTLIDRYPALNPPLPRALLGNLLWARGIYGRAAEQYRIALADPGDEPALLANNLGVILRDAGDDTAFASFDQAVALLDGRDLAELRFNLGELFVNNRQAVDAVAQLEQARNLMPDNAPLLLLLADGYINSGRLESAAEVLRAAEDQIEADLRAVPPSFRQIVRLRNSSLLLEKQALLDLAEELDAVGLLVWEVYATPPLASDILIPLRTNLNSAAERSEQAADLWRRRSTTDAAAFPGTGQTAISQAQRTQSNRYRQLYYRALVETELARTRPRSTASTFGRFFSSLLGSTNNFGDNLSIARELREELPGNPAVMALEGHTLRVDGQLDAADSAFDRLINLRNTWPEGYFGKGMVALDRGDQASAMSFFTTALAVDSRFFPAPIKLAELAERNNNWAEAAAQWRIVTQIHPDTRSVVALAQSLRQTGPAGYAEAEQILVPLAAAQVAPAAIELARLYNDAGRPDAAQQEYRRALEIDPRSSVASFELGETLARQGQLEAAETALRDALRLDARNVDARLALADLYAGPLERPEDARDEYRQLLRQGVSEPDQLVRIGDHAMRVADYEQAITAYERAVELNSNDYVVRHKLAAAYQAAGRLESAADSEQAVLAATGATNDPFELQIRGEAFVRLGDIALQRGEFATAEANYTQALQIGSGFVPGQVGLGKVAAAQGNWGVARSYFETATQATGGNDSAAAQFWLAESQLRTGDPQGAERAYGRALELQAEFPEAILGLAQVREAQGDLQQALATVELAISQRPVYAEAQLFRGKILQQLGRPEDALAAYDTSIRANPRIAETFYRRGVLQISREEIDAAVRDLQRAVQLQQNFPEAHYWIGRAYYSQDRLESALDAFRDAITLRADYVEAIYYSGLVAEDLGRRADAISAYQTVILLDGNGEWGQLAQNHLNSLS